MNTKQNGKNQKHSAAVRALKEDKEMCASVVERILKTKEETAK